ncbi:MAG TPA: DeoR/GlpR family DNA-binding transcription regulator [Verrucomicrobiae bacterium]
MRAEQRHKRIEEHLHKAEFASLEELAALAGASVSTVRRDVTLLESKGAVARTHGGARLISPKSDEYAFSTRETHHVAEKEAIGAACAELLSANQTLIIDAGTTCFHVARHLEPKMPQVFTNSLPVANFCSASNKLEVVVSGGVIYPRLGVLVGPLAVEAFSKIRADAAILSCGGVTAEGITNSHVLLIDIQRAMINAARRVILCVDSSKLGRQSITKLCDLDTIDVLITDSGAPPDFVEMLRRRNVQVIVATVERVIPTTPRPPALTPTFTPTPKSRAATKPKPEPAPKPARTRRVRPAVEIEATETRPAEEKAPDEESGDMPVHYL